MAGSELKFSLADLDDVPTEDVVSPAIRDNAASKPSLDPDQNLRHISLEDNQRLQLNLGYVPVSIVHMIDEAAEAQRMTPRQFLFWCAREQGVPIPEDALRDARRRRRV